MMNDITSTEQTIWNERVAELIKKRRFSQASFAEVYKRRYGSGTQADVNRWLRVGDTRNVNGKTVVNRFPAYETMRNIAELLGVSVGYLTGETDCETFGLEKACKYLELSQDAVKAIRHLTHGERNSFRFYLRAETSEMLNSLLTSEKFEEFTDVLMHLAASQYEKAHPVDHLALLEDCVDPQLLAQVADRMNDPFWFPQDSAEPESCELVEAYQKIEEALDKNATQEIRLKESVMVAKYCLNETFLRLVDDIMQNADLEKIAGRNLEQITSVQEIKRKVREEEAAYPVEWWETH